MMNILEQEDIIKGLPDQALMQEAQMPSGQVPQFLVVSEIQRRSDMRKRYKAEQEQMPQATVKEQVVQEGIMGAMPPQMAMAPQVPQRMPQMPPQGIQQAMPPQRMSGGGIVRMANGGFLDEVVVKAPNLSDQKLEELIIDGVPTVDLIQMGFTTDDISRVGSQVEPRMIREARKAGSYLADMASPVTSLIPDMPSSSVLDPDRADQIVQRGQQRRDQQIADAKASFMGRTDIPSVGAPKGDPFGYNLRISGLPETAGRSPILDPLMSGIGAAYNYMFGDDKSPAPQKRLDKETGLPVGEGRGNEVATVSEQKLGPLTIDPDVEGELVPSNIGLNQAGIEAVDQRRLLGGGYDAAVVDYGDATLPSLPSFGSGADLAASQLESLMSIIEERSAKNSSVSKGLALANIGAGMIEGKTGEGIKNATKILSDDAKAQGQAQIDMARLRTADAREGQKLALMRQDLANKLKITDRQSLMAALKSYGDSITALANDRTRLMTKEGQTLMASLTQEQALLRSLLIPDVDFGGLGDPAPTSSQPSGVDLTKYLNP